jgi:hypothetical protein
MANKFSNKGFRDADDFFVTADGKLKAGTDPWSASASGHGYNGKFEDDTGYKRGFKGFAGSDDAEFLRASQTETDSGSGHSVKTIYSDAMADQGPGPYGAGGSSVKQVGGGSSPPRFKPKSGPITNDGF